MVLRGQRSTLFGLSLSGACVVAVAGVSISGQVRGATGTLLGTAAPVRQDDILVLGTLAPEMARARALQARYACHAGVALQRRRGTTVACLEKSLSRPERPAQP